jgi:ABC-type sugar transport system ATPase subunit
LNTGGKCILEMKNITKKFPGTLALDNVNFSTNKGEVHVLMGENGAGKSTLVKILSGVYTADSGEILIDGEKVEIRNVQDSQRLGIGIIHQELNLLPNKTIYQNIFLGREPYKNKALGILDEKFMVRESRKVLENLGIDLDPKTLVVKLSIAQKQMVEVAKALQMKTRILIMDEPTSSLTRKEIDSLLKIVRKLRDEGVSIIYISHRLEEIFEIGDRITVLKDGRFVMTSGLAGLGMDTIITAMVGRKITDLYGRTADDIREGGEEVLRTVNLTGARFRNCSITMRRGEIVSLAGLIGAGRTELAKAIFGYDRVDSGEIYFFNRKVDRNSPQKSIVMKVGFLPEDRKEEGLILTMPIKANVVQASLKKLFRRGIIKKKVEEKISLRYTKDLRLSTEDMNREVLTLSGGNQQKVVVAKWLCTQCDIFIFDEPTRGIDVGSKADIYEIMNNLAKNGAAVLIISSDQSEIVGISDRTYVMKDGEITGELKRPEITSEKILSLAI